MSMAQHSQDPVASSQKALMLEMKSLQEEPVEGFKITLVDEADMYNWEVAIFGPPNTHYEGGYFKVRIQLQWSTGVALKRTNTVHDCRISLKKILYMTIQSLSKMCVL